MKMRVTLFHCLLGGVVKIPPGKTIYLMIVVAISRQQWVGGLLLLLFLSYCLPVFYVITLYITTVHVHKATFFVLHFHYRPVQEMHVDLTRDKQATEGELIRIAVDESMHYAPDSPVAPPYSPFNTRSQACVSKSYSKYILFVLFSPSYVWHCA